MKCWQAAVQILVETNNPGVMWGDSVLLHQIAARMGWKPDGARTEKKVLDALSHNHGELIPGFTRLINGRLVRFFDLPQKQF